MPRPAHDSLPEPPVDLVAIQLQPGAEANAYGGPGSLLWDRSGDAGTSPPDPTLIQRDGKPITIISRVPERW